MMTSYFKGANQCLFWHIHLHGRFGIYILTWNIYTHLEAGEYIYTYLSALHVVTTI